ncbi:hypothetical protein PSHT_09431 [Puccinia striiformis]|uniref:Glycerophosphocholine acyltransferase 1 n=1 Tax=Puccinia striiformis TaxID=27350 RepID=A0A2S4VGW4_9BASI|nr:hypothetical protein PSHT_09431 [Puccinia striiformis]
MNSPSKPTDNEPRPRFSHTPDYLNNFKEDLFGDGLPFYDLLVFIDSHIDLFKRRTIDPIKVEWETRAKPLTDEWLTKAHQAIESKIKVRKSQLLGDDQKNGVDTSLGGKPLRAHTERELREFAERELKEFVEKIKIRRERIQTHWNDSKTVSLREKTSFFIGVQNVLITALLLAFWPELIPLSYTLQAAYYLPLRIYTYRKLAYHYFLFDICYVINGLCLIFLWVWPSNAILFQACYGLAHGPSAIAIATWRNSLVFHSVEKVTSLFIHIYPALVFTVIRHFYPNATERFPALKELDTISLTKTLTICSTIYISPKDFQGGRPTSFTYLLNSKTGLISKLLRSVRPAWRANGFMIAQYIYTIVTMLPALLWFYQSKVLSGLFLWLMFSVSVWNGASFYMEVFGRRFEKELNNLKQEIDKLNKVEADSLGLINSPAEEVVSSPLETAHEKHE